MNTAQIGRPRRWPGLVMTGLLALASTALYADFAPLRAQAVLVELNPNPDNPPATASYVSSGGFAVTSGGFVDAATYVFDMGATASVSQATLRLPIDSLFPQNGAAPVAVSFFADDGAITVADYGIGFGTAIAEIDAVGVSVVELDVTGAVNAVIQGSRYVGFKVVSSVDPASVPTEKIPNFTGVRFRGDVSLEFTAGAAPVPSDDAARFDGFTLQIPKIEVPTLGDVAAQFRLVDPNNEVFQLISAVITGDGSGAPALSGATLLDCDAFAPPEISGVATGVATFSISSGILDIPSVDLNQSQLVMRMEFIEGTEPMLFETLSLTPVQSGPSGAVVSALGGGILVEPSQDFIPLCHGWVLIGDVTRNRVVERNLLSGETGATYPFNTAPNQFALDANNNLVYMTVHPESERLYRLNLNSGVINWNPVVQTLSNSDGSASFQYRWAPRDLALGENGNIFAIMFDGERINPENDIPFADSGLWLGLMNTNANFLVDSIPLEEPIRIEYDPVLDHVFLATASNLATFNFNSGSNTLTFVPGTDIAVGSGCTDFDVSPDGTRLAYTCPNGNLGSDEFSITDMDPENYFNNDGAWFFGSSPVSATFNADGTLLIGTDNERLYFFDVATHLILEVFELGLLEGESIRKVRLSRDGHFIYLFLNNDIRAENSKFYWMPMPGISGTAL